MASTSKSKKLPAKSADNNLNTADDDDEDELFPSSDEGEDGMQMEDEDEGEENGADVDGMEDEGHGDAEGVEEDDDDEEISSEEEEDEADDDVEELVDGEEDDELDSEEGDENDDELEGDEEEEEDDEEDGIENAKYEEDIEDPQTVQARRNRLPKSVVDDRFFSLAEMEAFLETQDRAEEAKQKMGGRNLGQFEMAEEMEQLIGEYERENLKTRGWALQGEAVAEERAKGELLEQFVDVDYRTVAAPTVTEEKTGQLESIIRKRIKEKLFDDVVRKFRDSEALVPSYRNEAAIELSLRKSLAEVYEDKFTAELNTAEGASTQQLKPTLDPKVKAIQGDMDALFMQLDALSHNQFRPQLIREEVKIVNNMPSLRLEEVGPTASAAPTANLLAPEEVMRRVKSAPKAQEERTDTDRKRERRHKKRKQHVLASIGAMDDGSNNRRTDKSAIIASAGGSTSEEPGSRKRRFKGGADDRKLDFAGGMQALIGSANAEAAGSSSGKTQQPWKRKRV